MPDNYDLNDLMSDDVLDLQPLDTLFRALERRGDSLLILLHGSTEDGLCGFQMYNSGCRTLQLGMIAECQNALLNGDDDEE